MVKGTGDSGGKGRSEQHLHGRSMHCSHSVRNCDNERVEMGVKQVKEGEP